MTVATEYDQGEPDADFMHWTDSMSVGVPELDEDHKQLMAVINRLAGGCEADTHQDVVRQAQQKLTCYVERHFDREQRVMSACLYPGLAHHLGEHREFVRWIRSVGRRFDADPGDTAALVADELLVFLKRWLRHHIMQEDMAYRSYAENKMAQARKAAQSLRSTHPVNLGSRRMGSIC